ncbi:hypothetical protein ACFX11_003101 [Malus domestica]
MDFVIPGNLGFVYQLGCRQARSESDDVETKVDRGRDGRIKTSRRYDVGDASKERRGRMRCREKARR